MVEELARHRCTGPDGAIVVVVEHRHLFTVTSGGEEPRRHRGAAWATLLDGEPVRYIDANTFEVIATAELLAHDTAACACAPALRVTERDGADNDTAAPARR